MMSLLDSYQRSVEEQWEEGALWAKAWHHAWTRNASKQYGWMNKTLQHYRKKKESLWVTVKNERKRAEKKGRR